MLISNDFMLKNETSKKLYNYAKDMPIFDYHCHLSPEEIAKDVPFENISQIWLYGDHYKWRLMRANEIDEEYITGNKSDFEKFKAFAKTLDVALISPIYHWAALELKRYFDIDEMLSEDNCEVVWEKVNSLIKERKYSPKKLIEMSNVDTVCTTDSPADDLKWHKLIKEDKNFKTKVIPGFRPDEALHISTDKFYAFIERLSKVQNENIDTYEKLKTAFYERIKYFNENEGFISDHGLLHIPFELESLDVVNQVFVKALNREKLSQKEKDIYMTRLLIDLAKEYKKYDWAMQIHFGAIRNNNEEMFDLIGADTGFDSMSDTKDVAYSLNMLLNQMTKEKALPKMIVYNLEPSINHIVACTVANFQVNFGKMQFGAAWWFNDTKEGMLRQLKTLADQGLISKFVGMLTDSRSLLSYTRHEYFRRILCSYIGELVELGEVVNDDKKLERLIKDICFNNAIKYFKKGENK